jgi:hypothetical protein
MSSFAAPIAPSVGSILKRATPRVEMLKQVALLKVRTIHAVLITLLVTVQYWLQLAPGLSQPPRRLFDVLVGIFVWNVCQYIVAFAIIAVVQTRLAPGRTRTIILLCAMLAWVLLWQVWNVLWDSHFIVVELGIVSSRGQIVQGYWTETTYLLIAAWCYESADRATRTKAVLRESELARRSAEKWLLELRLGTLQARLDPQVLFDILDEAGKLYRSRPPAAEQLLDALIDYLRRALPRLRQAESTIEREVELALAYARILRSVDGEPLIVEADLDPAVRDARFPAMVAQPLCDALGRLALITDEPGRVRISAARERDCARLCFTVQPVWTAPPSDRLKEIHHTLLAMFGPLVKMDARGPVAGVVSVSVEVPYDAAPRTGC